MLLSTALLAGLWTSLNLYTKIFSTGHEATERATLLRIISDRLSADLHAALRPAIDEQPADASTPTSGSATRVTVAVESFDASENACRGLRGGTDWLEIDSSQADPALLGAASDDPEVDYRRAADTGRSLRTVRYFAIDPDDVPLPSGGSELAPPVGLVRQVVPWIGAETSSQFATRGPLARAGSSLSNGTLAANFAAAISEADATGTSANAGGFSLLAPEVARIEFRYFDGSQWLAAWDCQQGLPVAVEIAFALRNSATAQTLRQGATSHATNQATNGESLNSTDALADETLRGGSLFDLLDTPSARTSARQTTTPEIERLLVWLPHGNRASRDDPSVFDPSNDSSNQPFTTSSGAATSSGSTTSGVTPP